MDVDMLATSPAFLVACFAALRLAKFNVTTTTQKAYFIGMPTPAVGLLVASLPLIAWYNPFNIAAYLQNVTVIYIIIAVLCWLMISRIKFFKLMPFKWPHIVLAVVALASIPFLKILAIPLAFVLYIILSLVYRMPEGPAEPANA
jgi:CDP-diacylglycerol--serine O-phosphatidyltransferase